MFSPEGEGVMPDPAE